MIAGELNQRDNVKQNYRALSGAPHRLGLHGVKGRLVCSVQVMAAVHLALKARLLPDWVVLAELWRDHGRHWGVKIREDKRLEYRPGETQVGWADKVEEQKKKKEKVRNT